MLAKMVGMTRNRIYDTILHEHLRQHRQMAFVSGPRQVGKTTTCRAASDVYLNWDNSDDRRTILAGPAAAAGRLGLGQLREKPRVATLDELHKFRRWKGFLKGFFDTYADQMRLIVTGSSRMDVYRRGGDSLMGRYFPYHMHPFTVAELITQELPDAQKIIRPPHEIAGTDFTALWRHGGFPEPFIKRDQAFTRRWSGLRRQQLLREDLHDLTHVQEMLQLQTLVDMLVERSGDQVIYSNLATQVQVSVDTIKRWMDVLSAFHLGFMIRPWFRNVSRSLRKEPKWYLRDWAGVTDIGKRAETFVACHLLKAVEGWNDLGLGEFQLAYLRDKEKREVDFVVVRDRKPWMLVEAKNSETSLSPSLAVFQSQTDAPHAFQVVMELEYIPADCFAHAGAPLVVPARTYLSQLL